MENPEKIYLASFDENSEVLDRTWYWVKQCGCYNTEYIRTDVFIEKACVKLKKLMYDNLMFQGRLHREEVINNFVEDFKKYMEGE